jgi:hypothetical protein
MDESGTERNADSSLDDAVLVDAVDVRAGQLQGAAQTPLCFVAYGLSVAVEIAFGLAIGIAILSTVATRSWIGR